MKTGIHEGVRQAYSAAAENPPQTRADAPFHARVRTTTVAAATGEPCALRHDQDFGRHASARQSVALRGATAYGRKILSSRVPRAMHSFSGHAHARAEFHLHRQAAIGTSTGC